MSDHPPIQVTCDRWDQCKERDDERLHQIDKLWQRIADQERDRMADVKDSNTALNNLALKVEGMQGKALGLMMAFGGIMTLLSLVLQVIFRK